MVWEQDKPPKFFFLLGLVRYHGGVNHVCVSSQSELNYHPLELKGIKLHNIGEQLEALWFVVSQKLLKNAGAKIWCHYGQSYMLEMSEQLGTNMS